MGRRTGRGRRLIPSSVGRPDKLGNRAEQRVVRLRPDTGLPAGRLARAGARRQSSCFATAVDGVGGREAFYKSGVASMCDARALGPRCALSVIGAACSAGFRRARWSRAQVDRDGAEKGEPSREEHRSKLRGLTLVSLADHLFDDDGGQCPSGEGQHGKGDDLGCIT